MSELDALEFDRRIQQLEDTVMDLREIQATQEAELYIINQRLAELGERIYLFSKLARKRP